MPCGSGIPEKSANRGTAGINPEMTHKPKSNKETILYALFARSAVTMRIRAIKCDRVKRFTFYAHVLLERRGSPSFST